MFALEKRIVIRLVLHRQELVFTNELPIRIQSSMMHLQTLSPSVRIDVRALPLSSSLIRHDRNTTFRSDYVFNKERRLAHHRSPASFVPANGPIFEGHLQVSVVDFSLRQFIA